MARVIQTERAKHIIRVQPIRCVPRTFEFDFELQTATFSTWIGMAAKFGLKSLMTFISEFSLTIPIPLIKHLALASSVLEMKTQS
jgi:hypothetical protein